MATPGACFSRPATSGLCLVRSYVLVSAIVHLQSPSQLRPTLSRVTFDLACMAHNLCFPATETSQVGTAWSILLVDFDSILLDSDREVFFGQHLGYGIGTATKSAQFYPAREYHIGGCIIGGAASTCTEQRPTSTSKRALIGHPRFLTICTAQLCTYSLASRSLSTIVTDNPQQQHEIIHR